MAIFTDDVNRYLSILLRPRAWRDAARERAERQECLEQLAASGDVHLVPALMVMVADGDDLSSAAARTVERLLRNISRRSSPGSTSSCARSPTITTAIRASTTRGGRCRPRNCPA